MLYSNMPATTASASDGASPSPSPENAKAVIKMAARSNVKLGSKQDPAACVIKVMDRFMRRFRTASSPAGEYHETDLIRTFLDGEAARWFNAYDYTSYDLFKADLKQRWGLSVKSALSRLQSLSYDGGDPDAFIESLTYLADEAGLDPCDPKDCALLEDALFCAVSNPHMRFDLRKLPVSSFDHLLNSFTHLAGLYYPDPCLSETYGYPTDASPPDWQRYDIPLAPVPLTPDYGPHGYSTRQGNGYDGVTRAPPSLPQGPAPSAPTNPAPSVNIVDVAPQTDVELPSCQFPPSLHTYTDKVLHLWSAAQSLHLSNLPPTFMADCVEILSLAIERDACDRANATSSSIPSTAPSQPAPEMPYARQPASHLPYALPKPTQRPQSCMSICPPPATPLVYCCNSASDSVIPRPLPTEPGNVQQEVTPNPKPISAVPLQSQPLSPIVAACCGSAHQANTQSTPAGFYAFANSAAPIASLPTDPVNCPVAPPLAPCHTSCGSDYVDSAVITEAPTGDTFATSYPSPLVNASFAPPRPSDPHLLNNQPLTPTSLSGAPKPASAVNTLILVTVLAKPPSLLHFPPSPARLCRYSLSAPQPPKCQRKPTSNATAALRPPLEPPPSAHPIPWLALPFRQPPSSLSAPLAETPHMCRTPSCPTLL